MTKVSELINGYRSDLAPHSSSVIRRDRFMEKRIEVIARYHYQHDYFVEVTHEASAIAGRDYWLCRKNSAQKLYMFSSPFQSEKEEEHMIRTRISESIQRYENPTPFVKYA